jgi:hypothetical protein
MNANDFDRLSNKYLVPNLPNFKAKGWLVYNSQIESLLRGFSFESSGYDKQAFNLYVFVQPLYVPSDHTWFNIGTRLSHLNRGKDQWWTINKVNEKSVMNNILMLIKKDGLSFLDKYKTPVDIARKTPKSIISSGSFPVMEAIAYSFIFAGDYTKTKRKLELLSIRLADALLAYPNQKWLLETSNRIHTILAMLDNQNYSRILETLNSWTIVTMSNLNLLPENQIDESSNS